jgi:hypothetical protein
LRTRAQNWRWWRTLNRRWNRARVFAVLWIVAVKLQVGLKWSVHWSEFVSLHFNLVHHVNSIFTEQNKELINSIGVDKLIWQAGVEFLVANPLTLTTCFYKAAKSGFQIFNGKTHGSTPIL